MTKHKHAEMIKAKADNMELVVFVKNGNANEWWEVFGDLPFNQQQDFFLCLPQHKEACLHWLNGGEAEENNSGKWDNIEPHQWSEQSMFMHDAGYAIRIKPRKEKRWIGFNSHVDITTSTLYESLEQIKNATVRHNEWQFIEIEIEVTK